MTELCVFALGAFAGIGVVMIGAVRRDTRGSHELTPTVDLATARLQHRLKRDLARKRGGR